jgi:hypothetical protein
VPICRAVTRRIATARVRAISVNYPYCRGGLPGLREWRSLVIVDTLVLSMLNVGVPVSRCLPLALVLCWFLGVAITEAAGQSPGGVGTLRGIVRDATGERVPSVTVTLSNPVSGFSREARTGADGTFVISGTPPGTYRLLVSFAGFRSLNEQVVVRTVIPMDLDLRLEVAGQHTTVTVEATSISLVENTSMIGDTVDRRLLAALPTLSPDSGLNDAIVSTTPGVAADSNGFFHPLGDHAQVSYIVDGQPITDQRNKVFSTSIPVNAIQTMEVISGAPPAEYGDKTSLVINATTRSGLGQKLSGGLLGNYGSFGTAGEEATLAMGGSSWGSFTAANAERSGRFLDTPEFWPMHDIGNTGTIFERIDFQPSGRDAIHLNLMAARNWMQVPNTHDQPAQDQRQKVVSFNLAGGYQRTLSGRSLLSVNAFARRDQVDYYPSRDPFDDSPATLAQNRTLANFGVRADLAHTAGRHNWKIGLNAMQTRLAEAFSLGITHAGYSTLPALLPFDLTRGGRPYQFRGRANIDQGAFFGQDTITIGRLVLSAGVRFDRYDGLTTGGGAQPRGAFSYLIKRTKTVVRGAYSHTIETPTNENLVASSSTGSGGLASNLLSGSAEQRPIALGSRNQYDAGIQQSLGRWVVVDTSYFRKYTRNAFDFDALFSTPVTFPIGWKQSKLDGVAARISTVDLRGLRIYATMGHANARFFGPENGGIIFNSNLSVGAYRQDHDQVYQQNMNLHYQPKANGWWAGFTWRYDSGLVVGAVNTFEDAVALTADQQAVIGLYCGAEVASVTHRIAACGSPVHGATRIRIPAPGTENDDHNPPRATPRNIFNLAAGTDNLFHAERFRTVVRFTVLNLSNQAALYNFLSPFSGTHWVAPRAYQAQIGFAF